MTIREATPILRPAFRRAGAPLLAALLVAGACGDDAAGPGDVVVLDFDFAAGESGWEAGFADYPAGEEDFYELEAGSRPLPGELGRDGNGFLLSGANHSDDLFMFLERRVEGLEPGRSYDVSMTVSFATSVPAGCAGVGGAPGESVHVKAGAAAVEPRAVPGEDFLRMNVDKGNQAAGGEDAVVIGNVANSNTDCLEPRWEVKTLTLPPGEVSARADDGGGLWLLVGTDSGFEATTTLYFTRIRVELRRR